MAHSAMPASKLRNSASATYIVPALIYLSLAAFPDWWGAEARTRLLFQFFVIESSAGILIAAIGKVAVERPGWMARVTALIVPFAVLVGLALTWHHTRSIELVALVGAPLLPRVIEASWLVRDGPWQAGKLVRESFCALAGCTLIGFGYLALMTAAPHDQPGSVSVGPPIAITAAAIAVHYCLLCWIAGNTRGLKPWAFPEDSLH